MSNQRGFTAIELFYLVFASACVGAAISWVANIVKFVGMLSGDITAMFVARAVGIFVPPLGAVLGFF